MLPFRITAVTTMALVAMNMIDPQNARAAEVRGKVVMTVCHGPSRVGVPCAQRAVETTIDVFAVENDGSSSEKAVKSVFTDRSGRFRLELAPGRYLFAPRPRAPAMSAKPQEVSVGHRIASITLQVDSGFR
jgi:hypothetical protein